MTGRTEEQVDEQTTGGVVSEVTVELADAEATRGYGAALAALLRAGDLVVLTGDLGAGKTTLTQGIGTGLGVRGAVASPTFTIARVHPPLPESVGPWLVHVDAYRIGCSFVPRDICGARRWPTTGWRAPCTGRAGLPRRRAPTSRTPPRGCVG